MKLTLKCLIDFRSWLGENHNMRMWEFDELPEFVKNSYILAFFGYTPEFLAYIKKRNDMYNDNFQKELDENNKK